MKSRARNRKARPSQSHREPTPAFTDPAVNRVGLSPLCIAIRGSLLSGGIALQVSGVTHAAVSNTSDAETGALTEIVVTAQRRAENIQDVPMSITALDTKALDQLEVQKFDDYIQYLPSVATNGANPGFNATVVVRGIVTDGGNIASGSLPIVGQYIDDQPITTIDGAPDIHMYDVARVEELSGPQGTLFGASSMGGVLRVITNKPDPTQFKAGFDFEVNKFAPGDFGGQVQAFINQPLGNNLALRAVAWYSHDGGFITNEPGTRFYTTTGLTVNNYAYAEKNWNDLDTEGGRAALAIPLGDHWTVTPSVITQTQTRNGDFSYNPYIGDLETAVYTPESGRDEWYQAALTVTGKLGNFDTTYAGAYMDRNTKQYINYSDYSYFYDRLYGQNPNAVNNAGQNINPSEVLINNEHFTKHSEELRITSPSSDRLRLLAGIFYQRQFQDIDLNYNIPGLSTEPTPDGAGGFNPPGSVTGRPGAAWLTKEYRVDRDEALFSELSFDITQKLIFTAGGRYYRYDNSLSGFFGTYSAEASCIGPAIVPDSPCTNLGVLNANGTVSPREVEDTGFTYRFNTTYKIDPDHLLYANVSDGFRPGGTNRIGPRSVYSGLSTETVPYKPDYLTNYEIGTKNTFWNHRATVNFDVFDEEWKDVQLTITLQGVGLIQNAGSARTRGVEFHAAVNVVQGLDLSVAATYDRAILLSNYYYSGALSAPARSDLPFAPGFKGNAIARYSWAWDRYEFHVQAAETYQSSAWAGFTTFNEGLLGKLPAYGATNLTAGAQRGPMTYEVYMNNVFDKRAATGKSPICYTTASACGQYDFIINPTRIGLRVGRKF
jgi:iron complex outermembrane recepter protein